MRACVPRRHRRRRRKSGGFSEFPALPSAVLTRLLALVHGGTHHHSGSRRVRGARRSPSRRRQPRATFVGGASKQESSRRLPRFSQPQEARRLPSPAATPLSLATSRSRARSVDEVDAEEVQQQAAEDVVGKGASVLMVSNDDGGCSVVGSGDYRGRIVKRGAWRRVVVRLGSKCVWWQVKGSIADEEEKGGG